jgi:hypothetical protein
MTLGNASKAGKVRLDRCIATVGNYFKGQRGKNINFTDLFFPFLETFSLLNDLESYSIGDG